jgi:hypothetical protein
MIVDGSMARGPSLRLELGVDLAGPAVVTNQGASEMTVWAPGNSWGDSMLSFETGGRDGGQRIVRALPDYTRNIPATRAIAPGGDYAIPFDLEDGTWRPEIPPEATWLAAMLEIPGSPEARQHEVWVGRLQSDPVPLR